MTTRIRRTKAELDPALLEKVLAVIAVGAGRSCAAAQAGISEETLRQYEMSGRAAWEKREAGDEELDAREILFAQFYEKLLKADTNTRAYMLGLITKAANGDWRAGAWLLEKLYPKDFSDRLRLEGEMEIEVKGDLDLSRLSLEELRELKRLRAKMTAPEDEDDG